MHDKYLLKGNFLMILSIWINVVIHGYCRMFTVQMDGVCFMIFIGIYLVLLFGASK